MRTVETTSNRETFELGVWSVIRLCLHPPSHRARRPSPERYDDAVEEAQDDGIERYVPAEPLTGCPIERAYVDEGYRGHDAQNPRRVFISGQKHGVSGVIKRELRRRSAIKPIIGHLEAEGHLGRCYLKGRAGDAANVVLSAVGHNFRRIEFLCLLPKRTTRRRAPMFLFGRLVQPIC
jgi:hypothetical protein